MHLGDWCKRGRSVFRIEMARGGEQQSMAHVALNGVNKVYPNGFQAIYDLNLEIQDEEFLVLVGPSGCGKSTALRMLAGLEDITSGELRIDGRLVNDVEPKDRDIAMVFQNYALYPHMTVQQNIGFALRLGKVPKREAAERVRRAAEILELGDYLDRKPGELSGGQRQRVAMGRAIVRQPSAFLMDEPLSNLDAKLRVQMRGEIARLQRDLAVTTVYVTHDQVEAMTMGTRVAVMKDGYLQQVDPPQDLYHRPTNVFVAAFIGSPSMNLYSGRLDSYEVSIGAHSFPLPDDFFTLRPSLKDHVGVPLTVGIRPDDVEDAAFADPRESTAQLDSQVLLVEALGNEIVVHLDFDAEPVDPADPDAVTELRSEVKLVGRFDARSRVSIGTNVRAAVNVAKFHFFDSTTGDSIGSWDHLDRLDDAWQASSSVS